MFDNQVIKDVDYVIGCVLEVTQHYDDIQYILDRSGSLLNAVVIDVVRAYFLFSELDAQKATWLLNIGASTEIRSTWVRNKAVSVIVYDKIVGTFSLKTIEILRAYASMYDENFSKVIQSKIDETDDFIE
jgi:hypothetical protein